jgi:hypothetical protein
MELFSNIQKNPIPAPNNNNTTKHFSHLGESRRWIKLHHYVLPK